MALSSQQEGDENSTKLRPWNGQFIDFARRSHNHRTVNVMKLTSQQEYPLKTNNCQTDIKT